MEIALNDDSRIKAVIALARNVNGLGENRMIATIRRGMIVAGTLLGMAATIAAQEKPAFDDSWFAEMRYRLGGPFPGGGAAAVHRPARQPKTFYLLQPPGAWRPR